MIFSPVVVPMFMQSNISPQFAQIVMRVGDSMTKGFTPLLASFAIYIGFLNVYNLHKEKPYTIRKSLQMISPYFLLMSLAWILLLIGWYILGVPIGPKVGPTIQEVKDNTNYIIGKLEDEEIVEITNPEELEKIVRIINERNQ